MWKVKMRQREKVEVVEDMQGVMEKKEVYMGAMEEANMNQNRRWALGSDLLSGLICFVCVCV